MRKNKFTVIRSSQTKAIAIIIKYDRTIRLYLTKGYNISRGRGACINIINTFIRARFVCNNISLFITKNAVNMAGHAGVQVLQQILVLENGGQDDK